MRVFEKIRYLRDYAKLRDAQLAEEICKRRLPPQDFSAESDGRIRIARLNTSVQRSELKVILDGYSTLRKLAERFSDFRLEYADSLLTLHVASTASRIRSLCDIAVLEEVLLHEYYRFQIEAPCVVLDIGMNVGAASLYFARLPNVRAVFGVELFRPTFEQAQENFRLNPTISGKITAWCEGASDAASKAQLPYAEQLKGVVGMDGPLVSLDYVQMGMEEVTFVPASEILLRVTQRFPSELLVVKMDCEGGETRVLTNLAETGTLQSIYMLIMEWHEEDRLEKCESILRSHGFATNAFRFDSLKYGNLFAVRRG